jgi:hypothetical protein
MEVSILTKKTRRRWQLLPFGLLVFAFVLLLGCSPDCEWSTEVRTWVDENENGIQDSGEPPLSNVSCFVESFDAVGTAEAVTNEEGEGHLYVLLAGCPREVAFFVYVLPPFGYRVATQRTIPASETENRMFQFGFVPINDKGP